MTDKNILVTGGTGYIGSHACVELLNAGFTVTVIDNLSNSKEQVIERIQAITGRQVKFIKTDLRDRPSLEQLFSDSVFDTVMHFAGLKAVGESTQIPLTYYQNNVTGTLTLLEVMQQHQVNNIIFSSSCTVYGDPVTLPVTEAFPLNPASPYGKTKLIIEEILTDLYHSEPGWNISLLRYYNPVGAHESGRIGEDPNGIPNNLFPYISQVAIGKLEKLSVFGNDYPTKDGTGVRDYIHVVDLAKAHLKAQEQQASNPGLVIYNLGTGIGYSVFEIIKAYEQVSGKNIPYEIVARRAGDIPAVYADPTKAETELAWKAEKDIVKMCEDTWRWQSQNPDGY